MCVIEVWGEKPQEEWGFEGSSRGGIIILEGISKDYSVSNSAMLDLKNLYQLSKHDSCLSRFSVSLKICKMHMKGAPGITVHHLVEYKGQMG